MSTGRRKGKKKPKGADALQVDLLADTGPVPESEGDGAEKEDEVEVDDAERAPLPQIGGDRWARAVGRSAGRRGRIRRNEPHDAPPPPAGDTDSTPHVGLGSAAAAEPRAPEAPDAYKPARDHAAAGVRPAGEPLARARDLVEQGRVHEAIELYLGILTVNPSNLKAHNNLGVLLDELKQYESALEHLEAAERLAPDSVEVLTNLASTLTSLARYDAAEVLLRRAQRISTDDIQVRLAIGVLFFRRGLYGQAEAELRWVCARDRDNGMAFYYRGEALNRLGRFDESYQALERAAALLPNDPKPFYTLGHLYDRKHLPDEAAEMYRRARRLQNH